MTPREQLQVQEVLRELLVCASDEITHGRGQDALAALKSMVALLEDYENARKGVAPATLARTTNSD